MMLMKPCGALERESTNTRKKWATLGKAAAKSQKHKIGRSRSRCGPDPEALLLAAEEDVEFGRVDGGLPVAQRLPSPLARTERTGPLARAERTGSALAQCAFPRYC